MQPIPRYWATADEVVTFPGRGEFALTIRGSSDLSQEDAQRDARARLQRLVAAGGPGALRGDLEYYPDRRLPEELLEEVRSPDGELIAAITRNRYGAAVLNTDAVLISDVDLTTGSEMSSRRRGRGGLLSRLFGGGRDGAGAEEDPDAYGLPDPGARGEEHARILQVIADFSVRHPELGMRTYRTRNGFRLLVTGSGAEPGSERARQLMSELGSDRLYVLLCRVHDSYRARLTPKPWRITVDRLESLSARSPRDQEYRRWVERYDAASRDSAVCRLLETAGPAPTAREQQVIELHDRAVGASSGLRLA
ncbi:hypothetical protein ACFQRD_12705 [Brachybacterium sp. GCM10030268]|uniref:hypothetical protein n=1 Tax=Brachybacterium sp. GCM10030268 TaxID=3273382 RepID=UPI00361B77AD